MLIEGRSYGCHPGVWKVKWGEMARRVQKSQHYLFSGEAKVKEGKTYGGKRPEHSGIPPAPSSLGVSSAHLPWAVFVPLVIEAVQRGKDSFPNAPDLLPILWNTSTSLLNETGRKIILSICCFIYLHSVMIYFDVSF